MVYFPSTTIPLNIFEPRYIQMINDSLATQDPIAMVMADLELNPKGDQVRYPMKTSEIIAGCGHPHILSRRDDNTMLILLKGHRKIRIGRVLQTLPYLVCEYSEIAEDKSLSEPARFVYQRIEKTLRSWIETNISGITEKASLLAQFDEPSSVVEWFCLFLISDSLIRQTVLETNDLDGRIQLISRLVFHHLSFSGNPTRRSEVEN